MDIKCIINAAKIQLFFETTKLFPFFPQSCLGFYCDHLIRNMLFKLCVIDDWRQLKQLETTWGPQADLFCGNSNYQQLASNYQKIIYFQIYTFFLPHPSSPARRGSTSPPAPSPQERAPTGKPGVWWEHSDGDGTLARWGKVRGRRT